MNNKGQALIEFILILPVLILILFGMIEIGNIVFQKYKLETHIDPIIELYEDEPELISTYESKNGFSSEFSKDGNLVTLTLSKDIRLITPGVTNFLGNPIHIEAERTFYIDE
nr:pilus assembly protein [Bacilli bacterium]